MEATAQRGVAAVPEQPLVGFLERIVDELLRLAHFLPLNFPTAATLLRSLVSSLFHLLLYRHQINH